MGRRGPRPLPTEILRLRGSTLVTKRRITREITRTPAVPSCPRWLDNGAKAAWRQLVPELDGLGILANVDRNALTRYCRLWSRWRKMEKLIEERGETYPIRNETGEVKYLAQFPHVSIASGLAQQLTRLEQEFGMTPSARARIQVAHPADALAGSPIGKARFFGSTA